METPLRGRSGGHTGAAPTVSFGQIARGWLVAFGWIKRGRLASFLRYSVRMPLRIPLFYAFYFCSVYFFNG
ncbi:hypothetical protein [Segatella oulorum]|uniref:hypothetical protein n=1 Tax=Segatella oulorum TaxID=28136 RepID=UPI0028E21BC7|nr:hypothetical protein [Segatella oulorum]